MFGLRLARFLLVIRHSFVRFWSQSMQSKKDLAERLKSRRQNIVTPVPPTKTLLFTPTFTADCGDKKPNSQAMSRQSSSQPVLQIVPDEVEAKKVVGDVPIVAPSPIDEIAQALNTKASDDEVGRV